MLLKIGPIIHRSGNVFIWVQEGSDFLVLTQNSELLSIISYLEPAAMKTVFGVHLF